MASQNKALEAVAGRRAVWMEGSKVCLLDQRILPHRLNVLELDSTDKCVEAIQQMAVRGAGSIGVAGGFAMAQAALLAPGSNFLDSVEQAAQRIRLARPTAKNLSYAVDRVLAALQSCADAEKGKQLAVAEASALYEKDVSFTEAIGQAGLALLPKDKAVLTHCNAGWLAYPGWGSALAPIFLAHSQRRPVFVLVTETRPRSQGAKLTAWELMQAGVPHALIADTAAGFFMAKGEVGLVIVGADRIAANGDTANKIGTYPLAVLAQRHKIPFYVAAPSPTFDPQCPSGEKIPIEERSQEEVLEIRGIASNGDERTVRLTGPGEHAKNPAFDVTPAALITGFLTEAGVVKASGSEIAKFLRTSSLIPLGLA